MNVHDEHRIVVLQCDECGQPHAGCRDVQCALNSRPYAGEDVVPAGQLAGAVEALARIERVYTRTMPGPRDALRDQVLEIIAAYRSAAGGRTS